MGWMDDFLSKIILHLIRARPSSTSFFLSGVGHLNRLGPPRIENNSTERFLHENTTLEIQCTGGLALEWIYPEAVRSRVRLSSQACPTCESTAHFTSTLTVRDTRPQDSGHFQCIYSRYVDHVNDATAAGINIFVAAESEFSHFSTLIFSLIYKSILAVLIHF